ncbi:hypothetical protein ACRQ4C_13275 [Curtobacterium sp. SP.BCp]|uniref:hypothetical protein n=1 Tax=Curtobacterium sp. SP.BCp TaxID=3435230 RepID=UPI003F73C94B
MGVHGWLVAVVLGAAAFVVGLVLQCTGSWHVGLAVLMVGVIVGVLGGAARPRRR